MEVAYTEAEALAAAEAAGGCVHAYCGWSEGVFGWEDLRQKGEQVSRLASTELPRRVWGIALG